MHISPFFVTNISYPFSYVEMDGLIDAYANCEVRPGARDAMRRLQREAWKAWGFTSGGRERVRAYSEIGAVRIADECIITCDNIGVGKPNRRAYERLKERLGARVWSAASVRRL